MFEWFKKSPSEPKLLKSQLVPRIKNLQFSSAANRAGATGLNIPFTLALARDLLIAFGFELPEMFQMATPKNLMSSGIDASSAFVIAMNNVIPFYSQHLKMTDYGGVKRIQTGNDLEASALLLRPFWENLKPTFRGPIVAVAPARDVLLACDGADAAALAELDTASNVAFKIAGNHALSIEKLIWTGEGFGWK